MKKLIVTLLAALFVVAGCGGDGAQTTETTDTAATDSAAAEEQPKKDLGTRVGDAITTATDKAEQLKEQENERVEEVNEAMDE